MPAQVKKIIAEMDSTPEMILGMLTGYREKIKHIAAVVVWEDDTFQLVHDPMKHRDLAWALAIFQKEFYDEL